MFADVTMTMRIAREEIFGPVLGIFKWSDEAKMLDEVNMVEYGLTCSIWTNDISTAHRTAGAVEAGFVWINEVGKHFLGVPFGGVKQSGIGREECFEEMLRLHAGEEHPRSPTPLVALKIQIYQLFVTRWQRCRRSSARNKSTLATPDGKLGRRTEVAAHWPPRRGRSRRRTRAGTGVSSIKS